MIIDLDDNDVSPPAHSDESTAADAENCAVSAQQLPPPPPTTEVGRGARGTPPLSPGTAVAPANVPPVSLTQSMKLSDKHQQMIGRVDERIRARASRVLANTLRADQVDEFTPRPAGWTDREYRAAMDARKSAKEAPVYIATASKLFDSFKRAEASRPIVAPELHADVKIYVNNSNTYNYRRVDVKDE